jgi:hypothetical protein
VVFDMGWLGDRYFESLPNELGAYVWNNNAGLCTCGRRCRHIYTPNNGPILGCWVRKGLDGIERPIPSPFVKGVAHFASSLKVPERPQVACEHCPEKLLSKKELKKHMHKAHRSVLEASRKAYEAQKL